MRKILVFLLILPILRSFTSGLKLTGVPLGVLFFMLFTAPAMAKIDVVVTYPYIKDITEKIGKEKVKVTSLARGDWDPHFIVAKPSLIAAARKANLLIINGAQLEIGWLPPIIRQANNPAIQPGNTGFIDLSAHVSLIQKPDNVSRGLGDVHPQGNPHFHLDPYNIPVLANVITGKLCQLDSTNCSYYKNNYSGFKKQWEQKLVLWNKKLLTLKGKNVVEYHRIFDYILSRYQINVAGTIEPLPGIPPTAKHISGLINNAKTSVLNLRAIYNPSDQSEYFSSKSGVKLITLPHDIGATKEAKDIFSLFDDITAKLTH